jgi:hypothetical protein
LKFQLGIFLHSRLADLPLPFQGNPNRTFPAPQELFSARLEISNCFCSQSNWQVVSTWGPWQPPCVAWHAWKHRTDKKRDLFDTRPS